MRPITIEPGQPAPDLTMDRIVITEDVKFGEQRIRKGHRLSEAEGLLLAALDRAVHAVVLEDGDVHEDDAGARLAAAIAGLGLDVRGPKFSRYNLVATSKGLLRVDQEALLRLNRLPGVAIFTLEDRVPVVPGKIVTGVKVTPVAVSEATVKEAESIAAATPVVQVAPFQPLRVGVISTEGPDWRVRDRFQSSVAQKIGWYGGSVVGFSDQPRDAAAIAAEIDRLADDGVDLVLAAGGNTIDPLDPTLQALPLVGAEIVRFGAPAHPGSMFWLAYRGDLPIFNLASCSMFSKATIADVVLPWIMTGERVEPDTLAALGFGGLLDRGMAHRFPPYDVDGVE
ncbi:MAG: molybdopterin-binding protein, partial [Chloroflexia bacterium]|nr:molybdopterin-binding protein [Chloroflexia bacterium]